MEFSVFQKPIIEEFSKPYGPNVIVDAVAGSGKTTTIMKGVAVAKSNSKLVCAFNTSIRDELSERNNDQTVSVKTVHGIGFATLAYHFRGRVKLSIEDKKYHQIVTEMVNEAQLGRATKVRNDAMANVDSDASEVIRGVCSLMSYMMAHMVRSTDSKGIDRLVKNHGLALDSDAVVFAKTIMSEAFALGIKEFQRTGALTYDEMIWLPLVLNLRPYQYDLVVVDECQDLSVSKYQLVSRCVKRTGRMFFFGDRRQAIYAFAGADNQSFENIKKFSDAKEMPLSICYRCPSSHLELAREIVPQIEGHESRGKGVLEYLDGVEVADMVQSGDLVLCRKTQPLVSKCYELLSAGKRAYVKGRSIGKGLQACIKRARVLFRREHGRRTDVKDLREGLRLYRSDEYRKLRARGVDEGGDQFQALDDKIKTVKCLIDAKKHRSIDGLYEFIDSIFSDKNKRGAVMFSTVHRAKGLESERVFILEYDAMSMSYMPGVNQEENLRYVALTRSKKELYLCMKEDE